MTSLIRYQPFRELVSLREAIDKLFEDSFITPSRLLWGLREEAVPAIDMHQTKDDEEVKEEDYICREHRYGSLICSVTLPRGLNIDKAESAFNNDVLSVTIPKSEEIKPKQIKVKAKKTVETKK